MAATVHTVPPSRSTDPERRRLLRRGLQQAALQAHLVLERPPLSGQRVQSRQHVRAPADHHRVPPPRRQRHLPGRGGARLVILLDQPGGTDVK